MFKIELLRQLAEKNPKKMNNKTKFAEEIMKAYPNLYDSTATCRKKLSLVRDVGTQQNITTKHSKAIIVTDTHGQKLNVPAFEATLQYIKDAEPDYLLHLGDVGEFDSVSYWQQRKKFTAEGKRLSKDIDVACVILERLAAMCPKTTKKVVILGNHDGWVEQYVESNPPMAESKEFDLSIRFSKLGWEVIPEHGHYRLGKLLCKHAARLRGGIHHAKAALMSMGVSCMYGHIHDHQAYTMERWEGPIMAWSIGCLCDTNPVFLKNEPNRWLHGVATVYLQEETGIFDTYFSRIIDGCFVAPNGVFYKG